MALLDVSLVTRTLVEVVKRAISVSTAKPIQPVDVTSLPPDRVTDDNQIGIYLYHLVEEAATKNASWRGRPDAPIRYSPLGLNLHYIVTAHSETAGSEGPYREQLLMSLAARALHDFPVIDDNTRVAGVQVVPVSMLGDDNKLRLSLRHVPVSDAVSYWTAGSHPLRLCAYYEVAVVLIDPDEPVRAGGRVYTWGVDTFVGGLARLIATQSTVTFTIPGDPTPRVIDVQPGQPAIGDKLTLVGAGLGGGPIELLLRAPKWDAPRVAGSAWGVSAMGDEVSVGVQADVDGAATLPGTWSASLRIHRTTLLANGTTTTFAIATNETPFQISPAVTTIGPVAGGVFTVTGGIFADAELPVEAVRASIGGIALERKTVGPLAAGQFRVTSPTTMDLALPAELASGQDAAVRIVINGAESTPAWVHVP